MLATILRNVACNNDNERFCSAVAAIRHSTARASLYSPRRIDDTRMRIESAQLARDK